VIDDVVMMFFCCFFFFFVFVELWLGLGVFCLCCVGIVVICVVSCLYVGWLWVLFFSAFLFCFFLRGCCGICFCVVWLLYMCCFVSGVCCCRVSFELLFKDSVSCGVV